MAAAAQWPEQASVLQIAMGRGDSIPHQCSSLPSPQRTFPQGVKMFSGLGACGPVAFGWFLVLLVFLLWGWFFCGGGVGQGVCPWQGRGALYLMQFNIWRQRNYTENPEMRKVLPLDTWTWTHWCRNASSLSLMMRLERLLMVGAIARQTHLSTNIYLNTYMCFVFTWVLFVSTNTQASSITCRNILGNFPFLSSDWKEFTESKTWSQKCSIYRIRKRMFNYLNRKISMSLCAFSKYLIFSMVH